MSHINFQDRVKSLREYKKKTGQTGRLLCVRFKDDKSLYNWCRDIRCARRNPAKSRRKLTPDEVASLDAIGFDWRIHHTRTTTKKSNPIVPNSQLARAPTLTSTLPSENPSHSTNYLSLYPMQQLPTTVRAPINSHAARVAATEIVDLYSSSPESTEREETSISSPDLIVVKAKLKVAKCKREEAERKREEAELMLYIAKKEAKMKDKKVPTKKRAGDNCSDGESKRIKVEKEVKVKIEEEFCY